MNNDSQVNLLNKNNKLIIVVCVLICILVFIGIVFLINSDNSNSNSNSNSNNNNSSKNDNESVNNSNIDNDSTYNGFSDIIEIDENLLNEKNVSYSNEKYISIFEGDDENDKSSAILIDKKTNETVLRYDKEMDEHMPVFLFYNDNVIIYEICQATCGDYISGVYTKDLKEIVTKADKIQIENDEIKVVKDNKLTIYDINGNVKSSSFDKEALDFESDYYVYLENKKIYLRNDKIGLDKEICSVVNSYDFVKMEYDNNKIYIYVYDNDALKEKDYINSCKSWEEEGVSLDDIIEYMNNNPDEDLFGYRYEYDLKTDKINKKIQCMYGWNW